MTRFALPVLASLATLAAAPVPGAATLTLHVLNVRNAQGRIHVDLCDEDRFLKDDCPISLAVPARSPETVVTIPNVPPGRYAAQLFHDENGNDKADRGLFGLPKEGLAFSRDAPIRLSPPRWGDAVIALAPGQQSARVTMRYWFGASGPHAR